MQTTKPKAIMRKVLPLFLSLAMLAGLLPVSPLGTMLINDAEARAAARGPRGGSRGSRPQGRGRGWSPGQCRGRHPAELCAHRQRLGGRGSPPGLRGRPPGRSRLMWVHGGQPLGPPRRHCGCPYHAGGGQGPGCGWGHLLCGQRGLLSGRCIRVVRWSTRKYRIPSDKSTSALTENYLG